MKSSKKLLSKSDKSSKKLLQGSADALSSWTKYFAPLSLETSKGRTKNQAGTVQN